MNKKILGVLMLSLMVCILAAPVVYADTIDASTSAAITSSVGDLKTSLFQLITANLGTIFVIFAVLLGIGVMMRLGKRAAR